MDLPELSRLLALSALSLPAVLLWRNLRRAAPASARRYMLGIIGMTVWAIVGVFVFAAILPSPAGKDVVVAAITFLLAWLGLSIAAFVGWGAPVGISPRPGSTVLIGVMSVLALLVVASFAYVAWA
ncbi:hypothetical protein LJR030_003233 [Rhizobium sp. LjRoot30]|uniref:hypothetical protein n=1 Tax=Rhizobium sp. LjRoot30 TaxID=3342320 RepID=UPI003ECDCE61